MRRQGQDVMQVNLAGIRRDIMNLAHNYSNAQVIIIRYLIICFFIVYIFHHYKFVTVIIVKLFSVTFTLLCYNIFI